ncbi:hypothetical protein ACHAPT_008703 [Fusarium lateritium]
MAVSILPVVSSDLPTLVEFVHSSKRCLTINRLLYHDWPSDAVQKAQYRQAVELAFNAQSIQCLKAVDEESNEVVGYLVLAPKTPIEMKEGTETSSGNKKRSVPEGMNAAVLAAVENAVLEIKAETNKLHHLELTYIYVKPSHRQKGIGSLLVEEAFRRAHVERIPLSVDTEPAAYNFFKNRGFRDTKHVDIDLRTWAPPYSGFGIFRLSGLLWEVREDASEAPL